MRASTRAPQGVWEVGVTTTVLAYQRGTWSSERACRPPPSASQRRRSRTPSQAFGLRCCAFSETNSHENRSRGAGRVLNGTERNTSTASVGVTMAQRGSWGQPRVGPGMARNWRSAGEAQDQRQATTVLAAASLPPPPLPGS